MISDAPINAPQTDQAGRPTIPWVGWFVSVAAALNKFWRSWNPTFSAGSMSVSSPTVYDAQYLQCGSFCKVKFHAVVATGGSPSNTISVSLPVPVVGQASMLVGWFSQGTWMPLLVLAQGSNISVSQQGLANFGIGTIEFYFTGDYRCA